MTSRRRISVTFLLPGFYSWPIGGYKVVYQYANGLMRRGYSVSIFYSGGPPEDWRDQLWSWAQGRLGIMRKAEVDWFPVDRRIRSSVVPSLDCRFIPAASVIVPTAWQTAEWAAKYSDQKGARLYLVQDYEYYMTASATVRARIAATYKADFHMLAVSPVVREVLEQEGARDISDLPNGVELDLFGLDLPIESPERKGIGLPLREESFKGSADGIEALSRIRECVGERFEYWCFARRPTTSIPGWVHVYERPDDRLLRVLYNRTAIFLVPSHFEGWGLPGAEAMACGAALVSTDNGGCRAYAEHQRTALLSAPRDPASLAANALVLISDPRYRMGIAEAGHRHMQSFEWEHSVDRFERIICSTLKA